MFTFEDGVCSQTFMSLNTILFFAPFYSITCMSVTIDRIWFGNWIY
jgi:hypothetical protein